MFRERKCVLYTHTHIYIYIYINIYIHTHIRILYTYKDARSDIYLESRPSYLSNLRKVHSLTRINPTAPGLTLSRSASTALARSSRTPHTHTQNASHVHIANIHHNLPPSPVDISIDLSVRHENDRSHLDFLIFPIVI